MAQDFFIGLLFVLCFSAAYSASGAMDNLSIIPDNQKHFTDFKLVSFVTYCSFNLGRLFDSSTRVPSSSSVSFFSLSSVG